MKENQTSFEERVRAEKTEPKEREFSVAEMNAILTAVGHSSTQFLEALELHVDTKIYDMLFAEQDRMQGLMAHAFSNILYKQNSAEILPRTPAILQERFEEMAHTFPALCVEHGIKINDEEFAEIMTDAFRKTYEQVACARPLNINQPPVHTLFRQ